MNIDSQRVRFKVIKIDDVRKYGSVLEIGVAYSGILSGKSVQWTDPGSDQDWSFYIGATCEIITKN